MKRIRISFIILFLLSSVIMLQAQDVVVKVESITPVSCGGGSDGEITISISGGIGQYSVLLLRSTFPAEAAGPIVGNTYTFTGHIQFSNYLIIVSDEDNVTGDGLEWATIDGPSPISITSAISTDITCDGRTDGTIKVTASGEGGNYIFDLAGPDPQINETGLFSGLSQGDHVVTVTDKDLCPSSDVTPTLTIVNPPPISISVDNTTPVNCFGDNTGSIGITPSGGTPGGGGTGYTYSWTGPGGFTAATEDIAFLEAGDYFVTVFDGNIENPCSANIGPITITQPAELFATLTGSTDATCYEGNDGTGSMIPGGGTGGYSFSWDGQYSGLISTAQNPVNLVADTYDFTLFDASGCSRTYIDFAVIDEPEAFAVTVTDFANVSCPSGSDGSAQIAPSGGTGPYTFLWSGTTSGYSSTDQDPLNMPADDYDLTLRDVNGCFLLFPALVTISEPPPITVLVDGTGEVTCFGGVDGSATITTSGGTPTYSFIWTGDGTGHVSAAEDPIDLVADTYDLAITDNNGCPQFYNNLVTIIQPADLAVTVENLTPVDCNGLATGAIDISPSGGTPILSFNWTGPNGFNATTEDIANLEAGNYSLTITDARGCSKEFLDLATITTNTNIMATFGLSHITCNGTSNGGITTDVSGGTPNYLYSWTGPSGFVASTKDISGLIPGSYRLTVTDAVGCAEVMTDQVLIEPPPIAASASTVHIDCFGAADGSVDLTPSGGTAPYTFNWSGPGGFSAITEDISGLEPGTYSVNITDASSCVSMFNSIATVTEEAEILAATVKSDISCGGLSNGSIDLTPSGGVLPYTFLWSGPGGFTSPAKDISGLDAGTYDLSITDGNGCTVPFPIIETITEPASITATYISQEDVLCGGDASGSVEIDVAGGTAPLVFDWTDGSGATVSTDEDPSGLRAGTYSLAISDANGCSISFPDMANITEPPLLTASLVKTDIVCYSDGNGTITVSPSGGLPPYEYSRSGNFGPAYQPNPVFSGLGPGFYTIWTRDANLCVFSDTISITEPEEIQILGEIKGGQNLCYGDASGTITISDVTGGVLPYAYSINNGTDFYPSNTFTNLPAGNYQTVVRDASECEASGNLNVITQPSRLLIETYNQEDITSCADALEGRIVISGTGGYGPKTYMLNDTLPSITGDFQNLPGGPHVVGIIDQNGCSLDTAVVILSPPAIVVDNLTITDVTGCFGDTNGEVAATGSGGSGTINYSMDGGAFQGSGNFVGLQAGNHTLTLMDGNGCTLDSVIFISEPGPMSVASQIVTPITCAGAADGVITILVTGGTQPLNYVLNPGLVSDPTGIFSGLAPGTYTVSVDDAQGCGPVISSPLTLTDPPVLILDSILNNNISCNGVGDGSIGMYVSGGVPPYEYSTDNQVSWGSDSLVTALTPGNYEVYVRDANLCQVYGGTIVMSDPPALSLTVSTTDISTCSGDSSGVIEATGTGGTGILEYSLNGLDFQDTGTYNNLLADAYTVYLRDEEGCFVTEAVTINEPAPVQATIEKTDATFGNLGSITISNTTGGTSPYEYTIYGASDTFSAQTFYDLLEADTYHVIIRDANGCTYDTMVAILDVLPLDVDVNSIDVTCFGEDDGTIEFVPLDAEGAVEYSIDGGSTFGSNALFEDLPGNTSYYLVAIDAAGKVFNDTLTIAEPLELILSWTATPAECNAFSETGAIDISVSGGVGAYTHMWSDGHTDEDRTDIVAGEYILQTTDANGCFRIDSMLVSSLVIVDVDAGEDTTICHGASIQLNGQGGHIPSWSPVTFLSDPDIVNPMAHRVTETTTYVLTITEETSAFGCFNTDSVTISVYPLTGLEVTEDTFVLRGTSVQLEAVGGPFSDYRWEPDAGLDNSAIPNPLASPQVSTRYTVYATNEYECEESDSVFIEVIEDVRAYNVFTPNGDGYNDYFEIENAERFPAIIIEVYSRWGDLLYSNTGYDEGNLWDGTSRGKEVPLGTYYYVIIPYGGARPITGNVTIIR